jgi:ABC-type antimicrobial peptide transport system permease subunit
MLFSSGQGNDPEVVLTAGGLAVSTALALGLNLLFAMYPAWKAARMNPADAVRAD